MGRTIIKYSTKILERHRTCWLYSCMNDYDRINQQNMKLVAGMGKKYFCMRTISKCLAMILWGYGS